MGPVGLQCSHSPQEKKETALATSASARNGLLRAGHSTKYLLGTENSDLSGSLP